MTTAGVTTGVGGGAAGGRAAVAGVGHLLVVAAVMIALGNPLPGPFAVVGLLAVGAVPAWLLTRRGLRAPALTAAAGLLAAVVIEVATPAPYLLDLDGDRITVGTPVLESYTGAWPLLLATAGLAGLGERALRRRDPAPGRLTALGLGVLAAVAVLVAVGSAGVPHGWLAAPPPWSGWGALGLGLLGVLAVAPLLRTRFVAPWLVLLAATGLATVASWVQTAGDAAAGLLSSSYLYLAVALVLALAELVGRGALRLVRRVRSPAGAAAAGPAANPSRS